MLLIAALCFVPVSHASGDSHEGIEITVNINTANAEELDTLLVGIGPEKAERIIAYRTANGKFATADDLAKVKGIGASTVAKNIERIKL
ncbi:ComEA family DNA-binding protein [Photobacterium sp. SDRW27]|uniref:ComEA family DNA-binding protein n=1 Tax=Photobacterium obscurum TaxID=2829490 RepID=UPI002243F672|nr:ComEA family DNA-binding protein [Photobacterium obscurum]MCW8328286.1 ComEA family DNA-binding protein [Photobacterium obscurum]